MNNYYWWTSSHDLYWHALIDCKAQTGSLYRMRTDNPDDTMYLPCPKCVPKKELIPA